MSRLIRLAAVSGCFVLLLGSASWALQDGPVQRTPPEGERRAVPRPAPKREEAKPAPERTGEQRRASPRPPARPAPPRSPVIVGGRVFIGGYFYDPIYGPYPWWPRTVYPYWYFPLYDRRAEVRFDVHPHEADRAAVYVDGFYAGIVDDFNNVFQSLPLPPGGHAIVLYLPGYRTARQNIYLAPGTRFVIREVMEPLPAGVMSEPPTLAPPLPPPPSGSYQAPVTAAPVTPVPQAPPTQVSGLGMLRLTVQPAAAEVFIDGQRWISSEEGRFTMQLPAGTHRVEITQAGYRRYAGDIQVRDGAEVPLNVTLMPTP